MFSLKRHLSGGITLRLSGGIINANNTDPGTATAAVRVDDDGKVYQVVNGTATQIATATDWVRPAALSPGSFQARLTNNVGDAPTGTAAEDAWHNMGDGDFTVSLSQTGTGSTSATFDLQVRLGGHVASASYTLNANVV